MNDFRCSRQAGFTLLELLAASALAALLMIAALQVVRSVGRRPDSEPAANKPRSDLLALVRWDLSQALVLRQDHGSCLLAGYGSLDAATLQSTGRPVMVSYRIKLVGSRRCLYRDQTSLDDLAGRVGWSELVAWDVDQFELTAVRRPREPTMSERLNAKLGGQPPGPRRTGRPIPEYFASLVVTDDAPEAVDLSVHFAGDHPYALSTRLIIR